MKRLLDESLMDLSELLTVFDESEIAKMRAVHEEEAGYQTCLFVKEMTFKFAEAKGISPKSLYSLGNILEKLDYNSTIFNDKNYSNFLDCKETMDFVDNSFEKANFEGKCCLLSLIKAWGQDVGQVCEQLRCHIISDSSLPLKLEDYEKMETELYYRYNLRFLEILLLMD